MLEYMILKYKDNSLGQNIHPAAIVGYDKDEDKLFMYRANSFYFIEDFDLQLFLEKYVDGMADQIKSMFDRIKDNQKEKNSFLHNYRKVFVNNFSFTVLSSVYEAASSETFLREQSMLLFGNEVYVQLI